MVLGHRCIYECQHPLWGGDGACSEQPGSGDDECLCDEGYLVTDSFGSPSCVSRRGLLGCYLLVALCGAAAVGFLRRTAMIQQRLSTAAQATRRARSRSGLIRWARYALHVWCSSSTYCWGRVVSCFCFWAVRLLILFPRASSVVSAGISICFSVAAAHGNIYTCGMLQALYSTAVPSSCLALAYLLNIWVDTLPSQLLPANSTALKVMALAEERKVFLWIGGISSTSLASFGLVSFSSVVDVMIIVRAANLITGTAAFCSVFCFLFVSVHLSRIINAAKNNACPSARAYYEQAVRTLRIQVGAMCSAGTFWVIGAVALEPWLAGVGRRTPVIPLSFMVLDLIVGFSLGVHFSMGGSVKGQRSSACPATPASYTEATAAVLPAGRNLRSMFSDAGANPKERYSKKVGTAADKLSKFGPSAPPAEEKRAVPTLVEPREKRVVPTQGEE